MNKKKLIRNKTMERISEDVISRYIPYLSGDEIYDIISNDCVGMGVCDPKTGEVFGFCVVRILPRYIHIEKIFTRESYRGLGVATELLLAITDLPKEAAMSFYIIAPEGEADENWLQRQGFSKETDICSYGSIPLKSLNKLLPPEDENIKMLIDEQIPVGKLISLIKDSGYDEFLQFPGFVEDVKPEGCIALAKDENLLAALFYEEADDFIFVRWMHYVDNESVERLLSALELVLSTEYRPDKEIRFLVCNQNDAEVFCSLFQIRKFKKINLFTVR